MKNVQVLTQVKSCINNNAVIMKLGFNIVRSTYFQLALEYRSILL